ncbi:hypothetical protein EDO6_03911 [Paenibacillus xylanexedens]|nr:hypothetical protein EDO6_03911 [Paenibacillus xylanexedens]
MCEHLAQTVTSRIPCNLFRTLLLLYARSKSNLKINPEKQVLRSSVFLPSPLLCEHLTQTATSRIPCHLFRTLLLLYARSKSNLKINPEKQVLRSSVFLPSPLLCEHLTQTATSRIPCHLFRTLLLLYARSKSNLKINPEKQVLRSSVFLPSSLLCERRQSGLPSRGTLIFLP